MSEERGERRPRPRGGRRPRRKVCNFCVDKIEYIDYKDINRLRRFTNERGKILPRLLLLPLQNPRQAVSLLWKPMNCPSNA